MKNLDSPDAMKLLDPSGVLHSTELFPDQCEQAWKEASVIQYPDRYKKAENIVVCGMGGSRFTPRTVKELFRDTITRPYEIVEDYTLPAYVNKESLVILSSYSGTTEEVLSCAKEAVARGAMLTGVMHGGPMSEFLAKENVQTYIFNPQNNPCGQPRIGGGYLLMGHIGILFSLGFISLNTSAVSAAIRYARTSGRTCCSDVTEISNRAKQLARILFNRHPFIITSEFLKGWGNGFANQINETAKMISDYRYIPELNHHLMEGIKRPHTLHETGLFLFITSKFYHPSVGRRFQITREIVEKQGITSHTVELNGPDKLAQVLEAFTLSGFTTFYLAMLYDTDPVAIPWVDYFKKQLAK